MSNQEERKQRIKELASRAGAFLKEKGLYLVLMVCLLAVGISAALTWGKAPQEEQPSTSVSRSEDESLQQAARPSMTPTPMATPTPTATQTPAATVMPDHTETPKTPAPTQAVKASAPVKGEISWGYAVNELVYSNTLKQWMTHCGVDVAASKGSEVYAVFGGVVDRVYTDDALGVTVVLAHSGERRTVYANLKQEPPVKEGQSLNAHELVGYVGDTAVAECADASHLHFEMYVEDAPVNPEEHITFQKALGE